MPPNNAPHQALTAAINRSLAAGNPPVVNKPATTTIAMSFDVDGSVEFTRNKALDTFFGGAGVMKRVSDIQKLDHSSKYYIKWLMGPHAGKAHSLETHIRIFGGILDGNYGGLGVSDKTGTILFDSYEAAVHCEIAALNAMREQGVRFDHDETAA